MIRRNEAKNKLQNEFQNQTWFIHHNAQLFSRWHTILRRYNIQDATKMLHTQIAFEDPFKTSFSSSEGVHVNRLDRAQLFS